MTDRRHALAFNAVGPVLFEHDAWLPLTIRKALADAVLAAIDEEPVAGVRDAARQATAQPVCACSHTQDRHNSACAHCPCIGYAQTWPLQSTGPKPPAAYGDGKGRVYCQACASTVGADVPFSIDDVDHWDVCAACERHVVDVARQAAFEPTVDTNTAPKATSNGAARQATAQPARPPMDPAAILGIAPDWQATGHPAAEVAPLAIPRDAAETVHAVLGDLLRPLDARRAANQPDPTVADDPVRLRWGLNDVLYGDDDTVTVCMSGPGREPYWLELDRERANVLRQDLAGPDGPHAEQPIAACQDCNSNDSCSGICFAGPTVEPQNHPGADGITLRDRLRRAICEASGFAWDSDMLEPDEHGDHADAVLAVLAEHEADSRRSELLPEGKDFPHAVGRQDATQPTTDETEARPVRTVWRLEVWDVDRWMPGSQYSSGTRDEAETRRQVWLRRRPKPELRIVRETTTWTVEDDTAAGTSS